MSEGAGSGTPGSTNHRVDIDGLRAVAVLLVVAYHVRLPGFDGGYIGVDVFFVISGFLITGILTAEYERSSTVDVARFWARRARRLLPAATLTLVATVIAAAALLSPLTQRSVAEMALYTAAYVPNLFLAVESADYFNSDVSANPLIHYWSLAVEEQFYLVWPLVVLGLSALGRRLGSGRVVVAGLALIAIASFVHSVRLTDAGSTWAYYSPLSRAWEFAAGGLLALLLPRAAARGRAGGPPGPSPVASGALFAAGALVLAWSLATTGYTTPFPGWAAVGPVGGTLLMVAAAPGPRSLVGRPLGLAPVQWLGRVSYSWYLWHWPVLVIARLSAGGDLSGPARVALAVAALGLAGLTHRLVEDPIRFHPRLTVRSAPNLMLALSLAAASLVVAGGVWAVADRRLDQPRFRELVAAGEDGINAFDAGCQTSDVDTIVGDCVWGDPDGARTVLVLGDSHAEQWVPALDDIGRRNGIRVLVRVVGACAAVDAGVGFAPQPAQCTESQVRTPEVIAGIEPDAVVVSQTAAALTEIGDDRWARAVEAFVADTTAVGVGVAWIHDTPYLADDPLECLGRNDEAACTPSRAGATVFADRQRAIDGPILDRYEGTHRFDPLPRLCDDARCPLRISDVLVYRDEDHLTDDAARILAPDLEPVILAALDHSTAP